MVDVAAYGRISKDEMSSAGVLQDPENQMVPMRKFCSAMGWNLKAEFVDRCSGGTANRPEFQKMLAEVRQRRFDLVLVWSLDRFSREGIVSTLSYIKQLKEYKTGLRSLQESWLDTSQEGVSELLLSVFSWIAQQERAKISQRTKAGLAKLKEQGVKLGRPHNETKIPEETKQLIIKRASEGAKHGTLAKEFKLSKYTIKRLIQGSKDQKVYTPNVSPTL